MCSLINSSSNINCMFLYIKFYEKKETLDICTICMLKEAIENISQDEAAFPVDITENIKVPGNQPSLPYKKTKIINFYFTKVILFYKTKSTNLFYLPINRHKLLLFLLI